MIIASGGTNLIVNDTIMYPWNAPECANSAETLFQKVGHTLRRLILNLATVQMLIRSLKNCYYMPKESIHLHPGGL